MEQKTINKKEKMFVDKCPECKKEITGYSEAQVNSRMEMHRRSHKDDVQPKT